MGRKPIVNADQIQETALQLFHQHGYDAVKVSDICDACGTTKPTFYHYVSSKDDLLISYYDDVIEHLAERIDDMADEEDCWHQIFGCFEVLMDESSHIGSDLLGRMLVINLQEDRHSFDRRSHITDSMVKTIRRGQESGQFLNTSDPIQLYEAAAYLFQGYEMMWCIRKGGMDWHAKLEASLRALLCVAQPDAGTAR